MVCRIRAKRIAAVWVARKVLATRWVSVVPEEQMAAVAAVATGVAMAQAKVDNQMVGVLLATLAVAVVLVVAALRDMQEVQVVLFLHILKHMVKYLQVVR